MMDRFPFLMSVHDIHHEGCSLRTDGRWFLADRGNAKMFSGANSIEPDHPNGTPEFSRCSSYSNRNIVAVAEHPITFLLGNDLHADTVSLILRNC